MAYEIFFQKVLIWSPLSSFLCKSYSCFTTLHHRNHSVSNFLNVLYFCNPMQAGLLKKMFKHLTQLPPSQHTLPSWEGNKWQWAAENSSSFHPSLSKNWVYKWIHLLLETSSHFSLWNVPSLDYFLLMWLVQKTSSLLIDVNTHSVPQTCLFLYGDVMLCLIATQHPLKCFLLNKWY